MSIKKEVEKYMTVLETGDGALTACFTFPAEFIGFQGHFPSDKVLPGVCQIQCISSMIEKAFRPFMLKEIVSAKFLSPVLPSEEIVCVCSRPGPGQEEFVVKASVSKAGRVVAEFKLRGLFRGKK